MNIKLLRGYRIADLKKDEQTDEMKYDLYKMILPFVIKYQPQYYPSFDGDLRDLASQFYIDFMAEVGRGDEKQNLLDKFDPNVTTLPYLTKVSVIRALIDEARKDKGEVSYDKGWDNEDEDAGASVLLDFFTSHLPQEDLVQIEEREFDEDFKDDMVDAFNALSDKERKTFEDYYNQVKNILSPNFQELFSILEPLMSTSEYIETTITITGQAPDFTLSIDSGEDESEEMKIRARNLKSAVDKVGKLFPGAMVISDSKISDSCKKFFTPLFISKINKITL